MQKRLEDCLEKEVTFEDFKKMKLRSKLKCYTYDWAYHTMMWPGWIGGPLGFIANCYFEGNKDNNIPDCTFNGIYGNVLVPIFVGAMTASALRTAYCVARDYVKIRNGNAILEKVAKTQEARVP
jgi:hypothetical protein